MPLVNPEVLIWARETAALTQKEASSKVHIAEHALQSIERGEATPSRPMLTRMAKQYRRPLLVFYLDKPPRNSNYGADFRSLGHTLTSTEKALLSALLRNVKARQQMIKAIAEEEEDPHQFVGWLTRKTGLPTDTQLLEQRIKELRGTKQSGLVEKALTGINRLLGNEAELNKYYSQQNSRVAFNQLRARAESAGVFVILQDNLGSHRSRLPLKLFRAFVIADNIVPFIVINSQDINPAKSFSLLHELVHLLLNQTGFSAPEFDSTIEEFCNRVAGEWLLPTDKLHALSINRRTAFEDLTGTIEEFARRSNLSHTMVATRLSQGGIISKAASHELCRYFDRKRQMEEKNKEQQKRKGCTPIVSYYDLRRQRLGNKTVQFVRQMVASGDLTATKAATILAVKPSQVFRLLYE